MTSTNKESEGADGDIVGVGGRILSFSCQRFIEDIVNGDACCVCGAWPHEKDFNDEHIIPKWVLRRFDLFDREITLPTGELRRYRGYRTPCCKECNSHLGKMVETPVSQLLAGDYASVAARLDERGRELLFIWLNLLFFKIHLKDRRVRMHRDPRLGEENIGDFYDWTDLHHIHAVARASFTGASLLPGVVGSLQIFEIDGSLTADTYDYLDFTFDQTMIVRLGRIGIVATLNDSTAGESAWSHRLELIDGPLVELQLRELGAMFAVANRDLIYRPTFSTVVIDGKWVIIQAHRPPLRLPEMDPQAFGAALLFAVRNFVARGAIEIDGTREPDRVAAAIATGHVRFLTNAEGKFFRPPPLRI